MKVTVTIKCMCKWLANI